MMLFPRILACVLLLTVLMSRGFIEHRDEHPMKIYRQILQNIYKCCDLTLNTECVTIFLVRGLCIETFFLSYIEILQFIFHCFLYRFLCTPLHSIKWCSKILSSFSSKWSTGCNVRHCRICSCRMSP